MISAHDPRNNVHNVIMAPAATESSGLTYSGGFVDVDKETVTVKVANDEIKAYMETVFKKATIVVDSTLAK